MTWDRQCFPAGTLNKNQHTNIPEVMYMHQCFACKYLIELQIIGDMLSIRRNIIWGAAKTGKKALITGQNQNLYKQKRSYTALIHSYIMQIESDFNKTNEIVFAFH